MQHNIENVSDATWAFRATACDQAVADGCCRCNVSMHHFVVCYVSNEKKKPIGDHALPQRGFGLGTPEGAEG
jgi:hypothetical protein